MTGNVFESRPIRELVAKIFYQFQTLHGTGIFAYIGVVQGSMWAYIPYRAPRNYSLTHSRGSGWYSQVRWEDYCTFYQQRHVHFHVSESQESQCVRKVELIHRWSAGFGIKSSIFLVHEEFLTGDSF